MNDNFLQQMQNLLGDEYSEFEKTLDKEMYKGLTINTLKDNKIIKKYNLSPSGFAKNNFYFNEKLNGKSPEFHAGHIYIQEPSASGVVEVADIKPGEIVLDMCAAPGGKSTQIALALQNKGLLVSNEYDFKRAQILLSNLERIGISENIITTGDTAKLAKEFPSYFDKVIVDAPCSGEGMMKKHDCANTQWSEKFIESCANKQIEILENAYKCCNGDGYIIYSTCTYNTVENEQTIRKFLSNHTDLELVDTNANFGRCGIDIGDIEYNKLCRVMPMDGGEGHFIAKIHKKGVKQEVINKFEKNVNNQFAIDFLNDQVDDNNYYMFEKEDKIFVKKTPFIKLKYCKVLRQGMLLGELKKKRFEPHNHFYKSIEYQKSFKKVVELNEQEVYQYLRGETLTKPIDKGYYVVRFEGMNLGFVKSDGKMLKNKYPKGLRNN